jgi:hypothetical protein
MRRPRHKLGCCATEEEEDDELRIVCMTPSIFRNIFVVHHYDIQNLPMPKYWGIVYEKVKGSACTRRDPTP